MYHTKKIGVFISHIFGEYQKQICQGIIDKALEYGYSTEIFSSMDGENLGVYEAGEFSITQIPNYQNFSGIIFASETYLRSDLKDLILSRLTKDCTCPIIEIGRDDHSFPLVLLENNNTVSELTSHLIQVHQCKRICYLGCSDEAYFSDARENYFRQALLQNGLTVGDHDIFSCSYLEHEVASALSFFLSSGPLDGVVCYNDRLALLFMNAASAMGLQIPKDFRITGCDDTEEGQHTFPALTTVSFPVYNIGTTAVDQLFSLLHGNDVPQVTTIQAHPKYAASCGCDTSEPHSSLSFTHSLNQRITTLEASILQSMAMSADFQHVCDIDNGMDLLEKYVRNIEHCTEFYLCLYGDWEQFSSPIADLPIVEADSDHDSVILKLALRDGKRLPECSFQKNALLPEHIYNTSTSAYLITPLFFESKKFGYIALAYDNNRIDYHFQLVNWFMNINHMLQNIYELKRSTLLMDSLESVYLKDELTGLHNSHSFQHYKRSFLQQAINAQKQMTCFLFNLNGLKQINVNYGHSEGDFALQVVGHALSSHADEHDFLLRFSGDEFILLSYEYTKKDAEDFILDIQKHLYNYNQLSSKPYTISIHYGISSASVSNTFSDQDLDRLMETAEQDMYQKLSAKDL